MNTFNNKVKEYLKIRYHYDISNDEIKQILNIGQKMKIKIRK